jgi:hypothetical protein
MQIDTINHFRAAMRHGPYAWPGGYPCYLITADGGVLSFQAARANRRAILESIASDSRRDGWRVVAMAINWEDSTLYCDDSGAHIECAYDCPDDCPQY